MGGCGDWVMCLFPGRRECTLEPSTLRRGPADQPRGSSLAGGRRLGTTTGRLPWVQESECTVVALGMLEEAAFPASPGEQRIPARIRADSPGHGERTAKLLTQLLYLSVRGAVGFHQLPPAGWLG